MKSTIHRSTIFGALRILLSLVFLWDLAVLPLRAQTEIAPVGPFRDQTIPLQAGWNSIYLEIEPRKGSPNELFQNTPIEIVASYNRPVTPMQFIESPDDILPDRKGWNVWYAPHREDGVLSNLNAIQAHHAYLVFSKTPFTWTFSGTPYFGSVQWHPNAYSLVGFPLHTELAPTVAAFFGNNPAHTPLRIYRMVSGKWTKISDPSQVLMQAGVAYWAYGQGASTFSGTFDVSFEGSSTGGIIFSSTSISRSIEIRSKSAFPQDLSFSLQAGENGSLPISYTARVLELPNDKEEISIPLTNGSRFGPLEAGKAFVLNLEITMDALNQAVAGSTLVITSNAGSKVEIPLLSIRQELSPTP